MSINRSELRDGNILRGQHGHVVYDSMKEPIRSTVEYYCSGMKVDKYWMEKLGFLIQDESFYYIHFVKEKVLFAFYTTHLNGRQDSYIKFFFGSDGNGHYLEREVNYVHEVQNLFFALTGKELTFES